MKCTGDIKKNGFAQIFVLAGMLLVSAALPVATKLVQQNQENRSNAAANCSAYNNKPSACSSAGCSYETLTKSCSPKTTKKTTVTKTSTTTKTSTSTKTCTYNCTAWTTCNSSGKQTCKAQTKPQAGCTGGTTKIGTTQNCTPAKTASTKTTPKTSTKTCTYNCTAWTTCNSSGKQTCKAQTKPQAGCTGGTTKIGTTQNCTPAKTASTKTTTKTTCSYICTKWDTCSSGWQTCTTDSKLSTSQPNCTGGRKIGTRQKCTTNPTVTKKADGSTCSYNGECTSGYCNLTIKKCATKVIPCTYICNKWSTCTNGKQTCIEDKKATATTCSGGIRKVNTTQNCKTTTTSKMWYYFNGTSCVGKTYDSPGACSAANKACFSTYDVCAKNNTPSSSSKTTTYYYYKEGTGCITTTSSVCQSLVCYSSKDSCDAAHTAKKTTYFYYSDSVKNCIGISYDTLAACNKVSGTCYTTKTACESANKTNTNSTGCSSSTCGKCDSTSCGKGNDCLWGYNGSSTMYCYPKTAAMPVTDKCVVDGKTWNNNAAICSNNIAYICKSGVTRKVEDCGSRGCDVDGTCKETVCSSSACGKCDSNNCGKGNDCLWGYNNSSTMYCYSKLDAVPIQKKCSIEGGICFDNFATCKIDGGIVIGETDCPLSTVCCRIEDKNISACDGKPIGTKICQSPYIFSVCTASGWDVDSCDDYSGEYCFDNRCQTIGTPKKEGDKCILQGDIAYSCPEQLNCVDGKCVSAQEAENIRKNKVPCVATPYNLNYVYDCFSEGLSCNQSTGSCEKPKAAIKSKKSGDFCNTDAECVSGNCMPLTGFINSPKTCNELSQKEYIDAGNTSAAIIGGAILSPIAILGAGEAITSGAAGALGIKLYEYITNHPKFAEILSKFGNINDAFEVVVGSVACAFDTNSDLCKNLVQDTMVPGSLDGAFDVADALVDGAVNLLKKGTSAATDLANTAESAANVASDLIQLPKKIDGTLGDVTDGGKYGITIFDEVGFTPQAKKQYLTSEFLASLSTDEYYELWKKGLNPFTVTHVTRQGIRDHYAIANHIVGLGEYHSGFTTILEDGKMLRSNFGRNGLIDLDPSTVEKWLKNTGILSQIDENAALRLMNEDYTGIRAPFGDLYADRNAIHFGTNMVEVESYGAETGNEIAFIFPADYISSQNSFRGNLIQKTGRTDLYVYTPEGVPGISLDAGFVFLPKSVIVDPNTGSRYVTQLETVSGQAKRVGVLTDEVQKDREIFFSWIKQGPDSKEILKLDKQTIFKAGNIDKNVVKEELLKLGVSPDKVDKFTEVVATFPDTLDNPQEMIDLYNRSFPDLSFKQVSEGIPAKDYWENYFKQHPEQRPNHIVYYDGDLNNIKLVRGQVATQQQIDEEILRGGDLETRSILASAGKEELIQAAKKIIQEFYAK